MTFKEKLIEKSNEEIDIENELEFIMEEMQNCSRARNFSISFIVNRKFSLGHDEHAHISFYIPYDIKPNVYRQKFIDSFKELGFTDNDITTDESSDVYNIYLTW